MKRTFLMGLAAAFAAFTVIPAVWLHAQSAPQAGQAGSKPGVIERLDPECDAIISDQPLQIIKQDYFGATEGATWVPDDGGYLAFSDMGSNRIWKWDPAKKELSVLMEKAGISGNLAPGSPLITKVRALDNGRLQVAILGTNGLALDPQGRLVFDIHGERAIGRREKDGTRTIIADKWDGKRFNGPNDIVVKSDGSIYFTDLGAQLLGGFANSPDKELDFQGIFRVMPDGRVILVSRSPANGIAFSPDEKYLYVGLAGVSRFRVMPDGSVADLVSWINRGTDGLRVDKRGYLYGQTWIANADGKVLCNINLPPNDNPTNTGFGDPDGKGLYIGTYRSMYKLRMNRSAWE